jgi:Flp pilus assembly CpaE family ATPase
MFGRLGYPDVKVLVVLNRRSDRDRIVLADAEAVLHRPVNFTLPNDYENCVEAMTLGQFVQRYAPSGGVSTGVRHLASGLTAGVTGGAPPAPAGGSRLARLLGLR